MSKQQYMTSIVLARIQNLQDKLSKFHRLSISLLNADGVEITVSSNQNPSCSRCSSQNGGFCQKYLGRLMQQAKNRRTIVIAPCPFGRQVAVAPLGSSLDAESMAEINYYLVLGFAEERTLTSWDQVKYEEDRPSYIPEQDLFREAVSLVTQGLDLIFGLVKMNNILLEPKPSIKEEDIDKLTKKEREILHLVSSGMSNQEIAMQLVISERTVKTHISNILKKLQMNNRTKLALYEIQVM